VHWWAAPKIGEIVWARFPEAGQDYPAAKPRPVLVIEVSRVRHGYSVLVSYGTSQKTDKLYPGEFLVENTSDDNGRLTGLQFPTKFDLSRLEELPYMDKWFTPPPHKPFGNSPKLGVLTPMSVHEVQAAWKRVNR
jgi:hypothetical protein